MQLEKILNLKEFKKWLEKNIGSRCKDYSWDCICCRSWRLFDELSGFVDFDKWLSEDDIKTNEVRPHINPNHIKIK